MKCKYSFHFAILICFILEKKPYSFVNWLPQLATFDAVDGPPFSIFRMDDKANIFSLEAMKIYLTDILKALRITAYHSGMVQHPRWFLKTRFIVTPNYNIIFFFQLTFSW